MHSWARFTNGFLSAIQIPWKLRFAVIPLLAIRSQQIFAHATTTHCSNHCIRKEVRVKQNFHQIWIAMKKLLVKRGPGPRAVGVLQKRRVGWNTFFIDLYVTFLSSQTRNVISVLKTPFIILCQVITFREAIFKSVWQVRNEHNISKA